MMSLIPAVKLFVAALLIAFASWLSGKRPELAGFIVALPLVSILAILFSYLEHRDAQDTVTFAKSIMIGVPVSYLFFLPFFVGERFQLNFWLIYGSGLALLIVGYFVHQYLVGLLK